MAHDQAAKLRRKLEKGQNLREAKTIAIASGKGGVGKSNVALNFSLELLNNGKKVLLIDLDIGMGNLDILLGLETTTTIADMLTESLSVHDIIKTGPHGLAYAAAGSALNEFVELDQRDKDYFFQEYEELIHLYDYIIFDMGAGAAYATLSFVLAANECIVVTTPEPTSITDAYGLIKHIANNRPDMPISVIMNRSATPKTGEQALERFRKVISQFLNIEIRSMGILPEDKIVSAAVMRQIPYVLLNEKAAVSKAMKEIAIYYTEDKSRTAASKTSATFVQKLKKLMLER